MQLSSENITAIIAVAAIFSPIFTAFINGHYQLKMKQLDFEQQSKDKQDWYKREVFENYISAMQEAIFNHEYSVFQKYGKYYGLASLYAPKELIPMMIELNNYLNAANYLQARPLADKVAAEVSLLIKNS